MIRTMDVGNLHMKIAIGLIILLNCFSFAEAALRPEQLFHKCYAQLTRLALKKTDPRLAQIKKNTASATDLCLKLIDQARLDQQLMLPKSSNKLTKNEIEAVFKTFNTFHTTWFAAYNFVRDELEIATSVIYDASEMAYPITLALFSDQFKFRNILENDRTFSAVRVGKPPTHLLDPYLFGNYLELNGKVPWRAGTDSSKEWPPELVEFGKLAGFKENKRSFTIQDKVHGVPVSVVPGQGLGTGGILGSASYLIINSTIPKNTPSDGQLLNHRVWAKAIMGDLLCRTLPMLREEDVTEFVQKDSSAAFRTSSKCMTCHATMDPAASVARNWIVIQPWQKPPEFYDGKSILVGKIVQSQPPSAMEPPEPDVNYSQRPPEGVLRFRSYNGDLVNKKVTSIAELAQALTATDDLYICAARRYFEFFTGVHVRLDDFSQNPVKDDKFYRFVVDQGVQLRKHQSLRTLVKNILISDYYQ